MIRIVAAAVGLVFVALAVWHFRMALTPGKPGGAAVPSVGGRPLFVPSTRATIAVGIGLLACAFLVGAAGGLFQLGLPPRLLAGSCWALALGLLARAIGEFRYVGFFKRVRDSRFARLDTWLYSPSCLALALGVAFVAWQNGI